MLHTVVFSFFGRSLSQSRREGTKSDNLATTQGRLSDIEFFKSAHSKTVKMPCERFRSLTALINYYKKNLSLWLVLAIKQLKLSLRLTTTKD